MDFLLGPSAEKQLHRNMFHIYTKNSYLFAKYTPARGLHTLTRVIATESH